MTSDMKKLIHIFMTIAVFFLLLNGLPRLLAKEDSAPVEVFTKKACFFQSASVTFPDSITIQEKGPIKNTERISSGVSLRLHNEVHTDSNGNVLEDPISYIKLLYMTFSLSDGFV